MNNLVELQHAFQDYLLLKKTEIVPQIIATEKVSAATRLNIYEFAYISRLCEALASNYPLLHKYLGDEEFNRLGQMYLKRFPSTFRSIRWFGQDLPLLVGECYPEHLYLVELAQIEWVLTLIFDAANAEIATVEVMQTIQPDDWESIRLEFHPSMRILTLSWQILPFWKALAEDAVLPSPVRGEASACVFWRKGLINQFCSLTADEAWAIGLMQQGEDFGQLCAGLCQWFSEEDAVMRAASLLKSWISSGLIAKVIV